MHEAMGRSCTRSSGAHAETHRALVRGGNGAHAEIIWGLRASPLRSCTALLVPVGEESTAWHSRVWYGTGWYGTVRHGNARYGTGWHSMARDGTGWYGTAQDGTVQHGMARYSTVWHGTGCSGTAQHVLRFAPAAGGHQDDPSTCRAPWLTPHPQHITGIRISPSLSPLPARPPPSRLATTPRAGSLGALNPQPGSCCPCRPCPPTQGTLQPPAPLLSLVLGPCRAPQLAVQPRAPRPCLSFSSLCSFPPAPCPGAAAGGSRGGVTARSPDPT